MLARLALVVLILAAPVAAQEELAGVARLDALGQEVVDAGRVPGMSVAVRWRGELVYAQGFGLADVENGVAVTPDTVFRIGSVTKQFCAATVMALVEDGALGLEDPLTEHTDAFDPGEHVVTVRHLLTHTGGFPNVTALPDFREHIAEPLTPTEVLASLSGLPFEFEPGARFAYNNGGYLLLGLIVEARTGQAWEAFLRERLLGEHGLPSLQLEVVERLVPHRARGYGWNSRGVHNASLNSMTQPFSAGAMLGTARDLVLWEERLLGGAVVDAESVVAMTTPVTLTDGGTFPYGFGLGLRPMHGFDAIGHTGGIDGFGSYLGVVPSRELYVAVLCNSESSDPGGVARRVLGALLFPELEEQPVESALAEELEGTYVDGERRLRVRARDGRVRMSGAGIEGATWWHAGGLEFRDARDWSRVRRFVRDEDGGLVLELELDGGRRELRKR